MDDPVRDIRPVIHQLTQGSPKEQEDAINNYFLPNASFTHPFCRTGSFHDSRVFIHAIFRWYKIMSPTIDLNIQSIAYDEANLLLYVTIHQVFAIWFIPFHRSPVTLTTVLQLAHVPSSRKYYIQSQNDLYQVDQFVRFFAPWGIGSTLVYIWHALATLGCFLLAAFGLPITWRMQGKAEQHTISSRSNGRLDDDQIKRLMRTSTSDLHSRR